MNNTTVAIVDDHTLFRKGLATLINVFPNHSVLFEASNGKDFINQLKPNNIPDIVLLDISMPEMVGYATCTWIKNNHPSVKVLALSTMDADTSIIKMMKCGAKGYILKDADLSELKLAFSELRSIGFFYNDLVTRKIIQGIHQSTDNSGETTTFIKLTDNELAFIRLACSEKTYHEIAGEMFKSEKTIDGYRAEVFRKLNVSSRVGLVMYAIKNGMVHL